MPDQKMHDDEIDIDVQLVSTLIAEQYPQWDNLPIKPVKSAGTDNAIFRLGDSMLVRLPRVPWSKGQVEKEQHWLPKLAPLLPLAIPTPLAKGAPNSKYPWHWSIYQWLEGENATLDRIADPDNAARDLAQFITAFHRTNLKGGPLPGAHNSLRGMPLESRDEPTRAAIESLHNMIDTDAATVAWESVLQVPAWSEAPVWLHGDLQSGNMLVKEGKLHAVIDFGCLGVGDPACDLQVAWNFLPAETRTVFRSALSIDDATWLRGRGWALSVALIALPYYQRTNPILADASRRTIDEVLAEYRHCA